MTVMCIFYSVFEKFDSAAPLSCRETTNGSCYFNYSRIVDF